MDEELAAACDMQQYEPFVVETGEPVLFAVRARMQACPSLENFREELSQDDEGQTFVAGHIGDSPWFVFCLQGQRTAVLGMDAALRTAEVFVERSPAFSINNALMIMFALATADKRTALFHASVVSHAGRAYLFLGPSGTGKSTHSGLWLRHIADTALVNDDNPVVRIAADGTVHAFGSPWSGKTPCYRNVSYPVGAFVQLRQAPRNVIRRLSPLEAYATLVPSISGKRWDARLADGLHQTENELAGKVPVWHLDCLPDEAAARLCEANVCTDND